MESLLPILLLAQGVMGGVDTLLNHELIKVEFPILDCSPSR